MSLMGIVNWLKKKIMRENKKEAATVPQIATTTDERQAEIEAAKKEKAQREAEAWGESLAAAVGKEKETGVDARSLGESLEECRKAASRARERLEWFVWRKAANNARRLRHRPMIREQAYIKAERNARKMTCKRMGGSPWR